MAGKQYSRRDFVRTSAAAAAGAAAGMAASHLSAADKQKILNYNENMEYRPWSRTGPMVSAVCLGGHWKRLDKVVPSCNKGGRGWLSFDLDDPGFRKNRHDVISKCIEVGINYVDACTVQECKAYAKALQGRRDKMYFGFSWYQEEMRSLSRQWTKAKKAGKPMPAGIDGAARQRQSACRYSPISISSTARMLKTVCNRIARVREPVFS